MNLFLSVYYFHQSLIGITVMLTQERLKEVLHYCPETGVFTWLVGGRGTARKGSEAGSIRYDKSGKPYYYVGFDYRRYPAHRLAFLYMTGEFPENEVDHKDGNGCNNAWTNLRAVTSLENRKNLRKRADNTSGTTGVYWYASYNKWRSQIMCAGRMVHLGLFSNKEDAIAARKAAEVLYGFHENHGTERPL
jgi:hypothetical protein